MGFSIEQFPLWHLEDRAVQDAADAVGCSSLGLQGFKRTRGVRKQPEQTKGGFCCDELPSMFPKDLHNRVVHWQHCHIADSGCRWCELARTSEMLLDRGCCRHECLAASMPGSMLKRLTVDMVQGCFRRMQLLQYISLLRSYMYVSARQSSSSKQVFVHAEMRGYAAQQALGSSLHAAHVVELCA